VPRERRRDCDSCVTTALLGAGAGATYKVSVSYLGPSLRRRTRRVERVWRRFALALVISVALNGLLLARVKVDWAPMPVRGPERAVALAPLSSTQWEENRAVGANRRAPSQNAPRPPALPPPPPPRQMPGQVVDVAPSKNETPPKDSRFVSDRNNTVEKETRSRNARPGYANTLAKPSEPTPPAPHPAPAKPRQGGSEAAQRDRASTAGGARGSAPGVAESAPRDRLALKLDREGELRLRAPRPGVSGTTPGAEPSPPGRARSEGERADRPGERAPSDELALRPSASDYARLSGGPAPDHLSDVEEGEGTYLNTREWKYAGYFNRIKQAVASHWDPGAALQARDPGSSRFGYKDWNTLVSVRLFDTGALKDVKVVRSSGLDFLDRSALDAFQRAQPFVNPPPGLADQNGEIAFSFGFYVEIGGSGLHLFRGPSLPR